MSKTIDNLQEHDLLNRAGVGHVGFWETGNNSLGAALLIGEARGRSASGWLSSLLPIMLITTVLRVCVPV